MNTAIFTIGCTLGILGIIRVRIKDMKRMPHAPNAPLGSDSPHGIVWMLGTLLLAAVLFSIFRTQAIFLQGGDEYCRANYALEWAWNPYFAPRDHVWLGGHFYFLGLFYRLMGSLPLAVSLSSLVGTLCVVFFSVLIGRELWHSWSAGGMAGIFAATEWFVVWASANPFAEVVFYPALLAMFWLWICAWRVDVVASPRGPLRRELYFLAMAFAGAIGTLFRYEMWYAGILFGAFLIVRFVYLVLQATSRRRAWIPLLGCMILAAYPVAWMISNWLQLGSPIAFLKTIGRLNRETNLFYDFSSPLKMLFIYPTILYQDHWPRLGLCCLGFFCLLMWKSRREPALLAPLPLLLLLAMVLTMKSGIGSNNRTRMTEFLMLMFLPFAAGPLNYAWSNGGKMFWTAARRLSVAAFMAMAAFGPFYYACTAYPNSYQVNADFLVIPMRLAREHDNSRSRPDSIAYPILHPRGTQLAIYMENHPFEFWMARYHSPHPDAIVPLYCKDGTMQFLSRAPVGTRILIRERDVTKVVVRRAHRLETIGPYALWKIAEEQQ